MTEIIHIEVYLKDGEKTYIGYEIEDKDDIVLFSTFIFPDCLHVFGSEEKEKILFILIDEIKKRLKIFKKKIHLLPENIEYQISCLIHFYRKKIKINIKELEQFIQFKNENKITKKKTRKNKMWAKTLQRIS